MANAGSFKPGQPRPPGSGRAKGVANKKTEKLLEILEELKLDPVRALHELLPELEPRDKKDVYQKLMEYMYPKRKAVEHTGANDEPLELESTEALEARARELAKKILEGE